MNAIEKATVAQSQDRHLVGFKSVSEGKEILVSRVVLPKFGSRTTATLRCSGGAEICFEHQEVTVDN